MISNILFRRFNYFNFIKLKKKKKEKYISYMRKFFIEKVIFKNLTNAIKNKFIEESNHFIMKNNILYRKINEIIILYIEFVFKNDLIKKIHC